VADDDEEAMETDLQEAGHPEQGVIVNQNLLVDVVTQMVEGMTLRRRMAAKRAARLEVRRMVAKAVQKQQYVDVEKKFTVALIPFFAGQIKSAQRELAQLKSVDSLLGLRLSFSTKQSAAAQGLSRTIFNPREWDRELVDRSLPIVVEAMVEGALSTLAQVGVELRKSASNGRKPKGYNIPEGSPIGRYRAFSARDGGDKASTASEWLDEIGVDPPPGVAVEYPQWFQREIAGATRETFEQDYWQGMNDTTLQDLERYIDKGLKDGWSIGKMAKNMTSIMGPEYYKGRSTNIARTESGHALNAGRNASIAGVQQAVGPEVAQQVGKGWLSVLGNTTRDTHAHADGQIADPQTGMFNLAGYIVPWPSHFSLPPGERCNCFPAGTLVQGDFVGAQRAWYEGTFAEVVVRSGARLTLTVNHPVVTSKGLVAAGMLKPDDKVLTHGIEVDDSFGLSRSLDEHSARPASFGELPGRIPAGKRGIGSKGVRDSMLPGSDQVDHEPAPIEQVFETLSMVAGVESVSARPGDFHGDGESIKGQIDIVRADRILLEDGESSPPEEVGDPVLVLAGPSDVLVGELGSGSEGKPFRSVSASSPGFPSLAEPSLRYNLPVGGVTPAGSLAVGVASEFDARLDESSRQDGPGISGFLRESLERHSRFVAFDDVVEVRYFDSACHVFDLQSRYGLIVANDRLYNDNGSRGRGIVTSNCQCTITMELGVGMPEELLQETLGEIE
jgi:hypothetical protein